MGSDDILLFWLTVVASLDTLLILMLFVSATSPYLYRRYRPMWRSTNTASPNYLRLRQGLLNVNKSKSRLGSRSKIASSRNTCRVETVLLKLQPPRDLAHRCSSVIVETNGCRGGCTSYSQLDTTRNLTSIVHSCSCCQPLRSTRSIIRLPCRRRRDIEVRLKRALECQCRPCYADKGVSEFHKLRDLLSKANSPFSID